MKEYILKVVAVIGVLFIGYLWSGGIWEYSDREPLRHNKITGATQYMEYTSDGWKTVGTK